ncbi:permease [Limnochorda pilosa]|uniref:Permease n=1 Tax=Limnochorda pilosa TaxID=1555112 RepID=A0A0K2SK28_LIMPI|nr:permease [Limnochorda pilosa]BAS27372.1 hypothetical protein LIP_1525 [Limnochorda pilosa]
MIGEVLEAGFRALWEYVALHVVTCLIPAFLLAGAMVSMISREAIVAYLGSERHRLRAFGLAAVGSLFIAACSCTVIPVASGLYFAGAGLGAAFIVLWVAPAANVLALAYTGSILGAPMATARLLAAFATALLVGAVMTWVFRREEAARLEAAAAQEPGGAAGAGVGAAPGPSAAPARPVLTVPGAPGLLGLLVLNVLAPNYLVQQGPYALKVLVWAALTLVAALYAWRRLPADAVGRWLRESGWFVRLIFPLLLAGVFVVGIVGSLLSPAWIQHWLGGSGIGASLTATLLGAISYFATMTEAPFVSRLMDLGMGPGPALALLLAGPGLSLPNMLTLGRVFGARRAAVYIVTVIIFAVLWGWLAGNLIFG